MTKFKTLLKIVKIIISNPKSLGKVLQNDLAKKKYIKDNFKISSLPTLDLFDLFSNFDIQLNSFAGLGGSSTPLDYSLLVKLAENPDCKRYFEIGTWLGESSSNVSKFVDECFTFSLSDDDLRKKDFYTEDMIKSQRFFSKNINNIKHVFGDSKKFDFKSLGKFNLIFIDGNHMYEYVKNDTINAFKMLKDENSVIVWHDYSNLTGDSINWEVFAGILDGCNKKQLHNLYHVSNTMCAIYINKKIKTFNDKFFPPNKNFEIKISTKRLEKTI